MGWLRQSKFRRERFLIGRFDDRLAVAESAGIIRGGCARLPDVARKYRDLAGADGRLQVSVSDRDAQRTLQVLHVVMRDLDPGR